MRVPSRGISHGISDSTPFSPLLSQPQQLPSHLCFQEAGGLNIVSSRAPCQLVSDSGLPAGRRQNERSSLPLAPAMAGFGRLWRGQQFRWSQGCSDSISSSGVLRTGSWAPDRKAAPSQCLLGNTPLFRFSFLSDASGINFPYELLLHVVCFPAGC